MPAFSQGLEKALHQALTLANERQHEYATLEHLLLALIDDADAAAVMRACDVDLDELKRTVLTYLDTELDNLVTGYDEDSKPTAGFQRVIQRAVIHVQSSGREEVTGANVLVAIFSERESHAVYFLQEQDMTRSTRSTTSATASPSAGAGESRTPRGAEEEQRGAGGDEAEEGGKKKQQQDALDGLLRQPQREGQGRQDRPADRPRGRGRPHHPDPLPPLEEQPALCRRSRRRQDRDRRGPGARSSRATCPKCCTTRRSSRSTWARCSPAPAIAATSRSG